MKKGRFNIIMGGQAGSEGKAKLAAYLGREYQPNALFMTATHFGQHVVYGEEGHHPLRHLPAASLTTDCPIYLGPYSTIDPEKFCQELGDCEVDPARVYIDGRAHTSDGVYAGYSPMLLSLAGIHLDWDVCKEINTLLDWGGMIMAETYRSFFQGSFHPAEYMAVAGVSPGMVGDIYGVLRPFPTYDGVGEMPWEEIKWPDVARECGYPGPIADFGKDSWSVPPNHVYTFPWEQFERFILLCRPTHLCLQFVQYLSWDDLGKTEWGKLSMKTQAFVRELEKVAKCPVDYIGTGKGMEEMVVRKGEV